MTTHQIQSTSTGFASASYVYFHLIRSSTNHTSMIIAYRCIISDKFIPKIISFVEISVCLNMLLCILFPLFQYLSTCPSNSNRRGSLWPTFQTSKKPSKLHHRMVLQIQTRDNLFKSAYFMPLHSLLLLQVIKIKNLANLPSTS